MFELVKKSRIIVGIILALIAIPFAFFGIDSYFRGGSVGDSVATVAGTPISGREYAEALRVRQDQMREQMGEQVDFAQLDTPQVREAVLDQMVEERIMYAAALKSGITATNAELRSVIADIPEFRENGGSGAFSQKLYEEALRSQGMNDQAFEALLRRNIILSRARGTLSGTSFLPAAVVDRLQRLRLQEREVSQVVFSPAQYAAKAGIDAAAARAHYDANESSYTVPEKVKVEYVILSMEGMQRQVQVSPEEVRKYYDDNRAQFETPEERRARHILIAVAANATPEQKAKARERAQAVLAAVTQAPNSFAEAAKKDSEDPGSAAEGGDLGFFSRGRMVKAFDDAVFGMKPGDVAGPIETQYGYHVIKLEEIKPAAGPSFESVKPKIEEEMRKLEANRRFAQAAEHASNLAFEQPDTLQPIVDEFKLQSNKSGWISRQGAEDPLLNNEKFLRALFVDEVIKDRRNTELAELAPNVLIAARVVEHQEQSQRPFSEVQAQIVQQLKEQKEAQLARAEGEATLERLKRGEAPAVQWSAPQMVSRERRAGLHPEGVQAVFSADAGKLPTYAGVSVPDGRYVIYRITKVVQPEAADPQARTALARQLEQLAAQQLSTAALASRKQRADVEINRKAIERPS
jgi:peptidyl-prolyl cis-trans isomerase D